jgi:hypothetical protein
MMRTQFIRILTSLFLALLSCSVVHTASDTPSHLLVCHTLSFAGFNQPRMLLDKMARENIETGEHCSTERWSANGTFLYRKKKLGERVLRHQDGIWNEAGVESPESPRARFRISRPVCREGGLL